MINIFEVKETNNMVTLMSAPLRSVSACFHALIPI